MCSAPRLMVSHLAKEARVSVRASRIKILYKPMQSNFNRTINSLSHESCPWSWAKHSFSRVDKATNWSQASNYSIAIRIVKLWKLLCSKNLVPKLTYLQKHLRHLSLMITTPIDKHTVDSWAIIKNLTRKLQYLKAGPKQINMVLQAIRKRSYEKRTLRKVHLKQ